MFTQRWQRLSLKRFNTASCLLEILSSRALNKISIKIWYKLANTFLFVLVLSRFALEQIVVVQTVTLGQFRW